MSRKFKVTGYVTVPDGETGQDDVAGAVWLEVDEDQLPTATTEIYEVEEV